MNTNPNRPINQDIASDKNQGPINCHYEPIYRRQSTQFVPAGHKAIAFLHDMGVEAYTTRLDPNQDQLSNLIRLNMSGAQQFEILQLQLGSFLSQKKLQPNQKMVFELDSAGLANNPFTMTEFAELLESDSSRHLKADDIVIELSCASDIDKKALFSVTHQLKQMGVMIALIDQDVDAFSYSKIIEIKPDIVKFNRSWCEYDLNDVSYLRMVKDIVENLNTDGTFTGLTGIRGFREFRFAAHCNFTRCQGRYFGIPSEEMIIGQPIAIPS